MAAVLGSVKTCSTKNNAVGKLSPMHGQYKKLALEMQATEPHEDRDVHGAAIQAQVSWPWYGTCRPEVRQAHAVNVATGHHNQLLLQRPRRPSLLHRGPSIEQLQQLGRSRPFLPEDAQQALHNHMIA